MAQTGPTTITLIIIGVIIYSILFGNPFVYDNSTVLQGPDSDSVKDTIELYNMTTEVLMYNINDMIDTEILDMGNLLE